MYIYIAALGVELRARQALFRLSHAFDPFCFAYFLCQEGLYHNLPIYTFLVAGITGACHQAWLLVVEMWSGELFSQAGCELLEPLSSESLPPE
jgi:hypothetical protein